MKETHFYFNVDCRGKRTHFIIREWKLPQDNKKIKPDSVLQIHNKHKVLLPIFYLDIYKEVISLNDFDK